MDVDFSSFLPPGWSEVDMDCSLGCTPLSIDDWESFKYAREEQELLDTEKVMREAKERDQEDLCQE